MFGYSKILYGSKAKLSYGFTLTFTQVRHVKHTCSYHGASRAGPLPLICRRARGAMRKFECGLHASPQRVLMPLSHSDARRSWSIREPYTPSSLEPA